MASRTSKIKEPTTKGGAKYINIDKDYPKWKEKHKINDETAFKAMSKVRNNYESSKSALMTSCFWDSYQEDSSGAVLNGGSWYDRWTLQEKQAIMWYRKPGVDDFISNIKSPMSRGRINTFVNFMKKIGIEFGAKPNNEADRNASFTADKTINYWFRQSNAKLALFDAYEDLGTSGNAYLKLGYVQEYKDYQFPKTKDLSEEESKEVKEGTKKVVYGPKEHTLVTDDIVLEFVPKREIFPDPMARNLHGDSYRAGWIIRKRFVTLDYLKSIYSDHPNVKYLDKVEGATAYNDTTEYFFEPPRNIMGDNIVELLEMEDQDNDRFYVVANDICIIGCEDDEPLPYDHKEISYHKLDFIRVPGQFFSIGLCDLLDNIQSSYEIALNMVADYIYRTYNYKMLVESDNYGEVVQALKRTGDMFVPLDVSDGKPLNSKVMPLQVSPISFDIFTFLEILERQATLATNIDPAQMAMLAGSKTATSDILNKELLMTMIGGVIENNVNGDLRAIGRQVWKLQQQFYSKPRVRKIIGDEKPVMEPRTLTFEGIKIEINNDSGLLEEKEIEGDYSFFEPKKYLSTKDELDIYIKPESKEVSSQALDEQRMAEEFAQLIPFAVDPNNAQQLQQHPMAMIDAVELFNEYRDVKKLPSKLLLNKSKSNDATVKKAEEDVMKILTGRHVQAIPGQSTPYLEYCYQVLDGLVFGRDEKMDALEKDLTTKTDKLMKIVSQLPQVDPATGQPLQIPQPQPDPRLVESVEHFDEVIQKLQMHLTISSMPAAMRNSRVLAMQQPSQPPMGDMGMMGGQPPMPQGSPMMEAPMPQGGQNPIDPSMINSPNPAGEVPMGAPMSPMGPNSLPPLS